MKKINAFILFSNVEQTNQTVEELKQSGFSSKNLSVSRENTEETISGCENFASMRCKHNNDEENRGELDGDYTLIYLKPTVLRLGYFGLERMLRIAEDTRAGWCMPIITG